MTAFLSSRSHKCNRPPIYLLCFHHDMILCSWIIHPTFHWSTHWKSIQPVFCFFSLFGLSSLPNNSTSNVLFGVNGCNTKMPWPTRLSSEKLDWLKQRTYKPVATNGYIYRVIVLSILQIPLIPIRNQARIRTEIFCLVWMQCIEVHNNNIFIEYNAWLGEMIATTFYCRQCWERTRIAKSCFERL
jgi:hypothetical protein